MTKFRPQVELLGERINPDATFLVQPLNYIPDAPVSQIAVTTVTANQIQTVNSTTDFANTIPPSPLQIRIDELAKEFTNLLNERNGLSQQRLNLLGVVQGLQAAVNEAVKSYNTRLAAMKAAGCTAEQILNDQSLLALYNLTKTLKTLRDDANTKISDIDKRIAGIDARQVIVFNELLRLGAQLIGENPTPR